MQQTFAPETVSAKANHDSKSSPRLLLLFVWTCAVAAVWLYGLPWIASSPAVNSYISWLDERGIDPSAMYYTELEAMKPILERLNEQEVKNANRH